MSKRKSNKNLNKTTNDYLIMSVILFLLCIWAIKDAWFPSPTVLKKHPHSIPITFTSSGYIQEIYIDKGDLVTDEMIIAKIDTNDEVATFNWKKGGVVSNIHKKKYDYVNIGEKVVSIKPNDTFYHFNQTLAIVSGLGSVIFILIHIKT